MAVWEYVLAHWVDWLFAGITAAAGLGYRSVSKKLKTEHEKNEAIASGVQCLLRESIIDNYNKYTDKGYCPIYAKESLRRAYESYHDGLNGNDVATELYHKLLAMPGEPPKEKEN